MKGLTRMLQCVPRAQQHLKDSSVPRLRPINLVDHQRGMTLIELVVVISLVAIIGSFVVLRLDSLLSWRAESDIRQFTHALQLIRNDSLQRQERYRMVINLDSQTYYVRREVPLEPGEIKNVDLLQNLRTKGEQARRQQEEETDLLSLDEEFKELDIAEGGALEQRYYQSIFADPEANVRLGVPLNFPSMAEAKGFDSAVKIRDIEIGDQKIERGTVALRFLARAPSPEALIHFQAIDETQIYTITIHPQAQNISILGGDISAKDAFKTLRYEKSDAN